VASCWFFVRRFCCQPLLCRKKRAIPGNRHTYDLPFKGSAEGELAASHTPIVPVVLGD
jgi:hypothetical protein